MRLKTELVNVAVNGNLPRLKELVTPSNVNIRVSWLYYKWTLLEIVANQGHDHCIPFLLSSGAIVICLDEFRMTALHYAISSNYIQCCRILMDAWPRRNGEPVETILCPLRYSLENRNFQAVAELTKRGWPLEKYRDFCDNYEKYRIPFHQFYTRYINTKNSIAIWIMTTRSLNCRLRRIIGKDMIHLITKEMWEEGIKF